MVGLKDAPTAPPPDNLSLGLSLTRLGIGSTLFIVELVQVFYHWGHKLLDPRQPLLPSVRLDRACIASGRKQVTHCL
jgi:hypothetical protein